MNRTLPVLLGLRLLRGQGRTGLTRVFLMVVGTALGVGLLLVALSVQPVLHARDARLAARTPACAGASAEQACALGVAVQDSWAGRAVTRMLVDVPAGTPAPAGVARLPRPGEVVLSPALQRIVDAPGGSLLRQRFPARVIGTIGDAGLLQPDELYAYVGDTGVRPEDSAAVTGYGNTDVAGLSTPRHGSIDPRSMTTGVTAIVLLLPVLLFLASCARLSARTRDRRLAALRLVGMTPLQTRLVNAVETGVAAAGGSLLGLLAFELLRRPLSRLQLDGWGWFASDAHPTTGHLLALVVGAPVLAVVVGTVAVHGVTGALTAGRTEVSVRRLRRWRLVPLVGALAVLVWVDTHGSAVRDHAGVALSGIALAVVGLAVAVPLLSQLAAGGLARVTGSLSLQLGARRLQGDAPGVTRVVTGLVLLVFTAGLVQSILVAVHREVLADANPWTLSLRPSVVQVPGVDRHGQTIATSTWAGVPGVTGVVGLPEVAVTAPAKGGEATVDGPRALVATCATLASILGSAVEGCHEGVPTWMPDAQVEEKTLHLQAISPGDSARVGPVAAVPAPRERLESGFPDALSNTFGVQLLLPPDLPALSALSLQPPSTFYVRTDGSARTVEVLRTTAARLDPALTVTTAAELRASDSGVGDYHFALYRDLVDWGSAIALAVAFASVAVTTVDRAVERRRHLALQTAIGVPASVMRRAQLVQVLVPYGIGIALAATLSLLSGLAYASMMQRGATTALPVRDVVATVAVALAGAVVVAVSVLPSIGRPLTPDLLRQE